MNTDNGTLSFDAWIDNTNFKRQIDEMTQKMRNLGDTAKQEGAGMDSTMKKVGLAMGGYFSAQMFMRFGMAVKNVRGEFEQMGVAFEVMLGSKEKADALMGQIVTLAAKTPFTLSEVGSVTKQLLAFGADSGSVVETVKRLGDVAAGTGTEIKGLALAFGQVMTKGKLQTQEMYQMAERGVPIIAELSKMFGVSTKEIMKMVESGSVGFSDVQQAIKNMTSEGGIFNNMMIKQSATVTGLWSNMTDAWDEMLNSMGEGSEGILKGSIEGVTYLIKNYDELLKVIGVAIVAFGTYKAAVMLTAVVERAHTAIMMEQALASKAITTWEALHAVILKKLAVAQALFNKTLLANPYALAIAGIIALVTAIILYSNRLSAAESAEEEFSNRQKELSDAADANRQAMENNLAIVTDMARAELDRVAALGELQKKYPEIFSQYDLETIKLADILKLKNQINEVESARTVETNKYDLEKAQARISVLEKWLEQSKSFGGELALWKTTGMTRNNIESELATAREALKKYQGQVQEDRNNIVYKGLKQYTDEQLQAELANHQKLLESMKAQGAPTTATVKEGMFTGTFNEEEIKRQTEVLKAEMSRRNVATYDYYGLLKKYEAERVDLEKQRTTIQANKDKLPEAELLAQLAAVDAKLKAIEEKKQALVGKKPEVVKVDTSADMAAFDDAIKQKKAQYEMYYQWVVEMSKESADKEFSELLSKGASYSAYIQGEIDRLKAKATLSPAEKEQLKKLQQDVLPEAVEFTKTSDINVYTQALQSQSDTFTDLTKQIEFLKGELGAIDATSSVGMQKRLVVLGMLNKAQKDYAEQERDRYKELKKDYMDIQQQIVAATDQTNKDVALLNKNGDTAQAAERQRQGDIQIKSLRDQALEQMGLLDVFAGTGTDFIEKKIKAIIPTFTNFSDLTRKQLKEVKTLVDNIEITPEQFAALEKAGVDTTVLKAMLAKLKADTDKGIDLADWEKLRDLVAGISSGLRSLGSALSQVDGALGDVGNALGQAGNAMDAIVMLMNDATTTGDRLAAGMSAISEIVGMIIQQSEQNREVMDDWGEAVNATASEMAKLRVEMLEYQQANFFGVENPFQAAVDGAMQYAQAIQELVGLEEDLANALIQTGTAKKVDWENVGTGAAAGAVLGATIGSAIPVVGTLIGAAAGAIIGGLVGLFDREVVPVFATLKDEFGEVYDPETFALNPDIIANYDKLSDAAKQIVDNWQEIQQQAEEAKKQMEDTFASFSGTLGNDLRDTLVEAFRNGDLYSAIDSFHAKVTGVLEDIIAQMIFGTIFQKYFDDLQAGMMASFEEGGDLTIVDDMLAFMEQYTAALPAFDAAMQAAQDAMGDFGFDLFKPSETAQDQLSAAIKGVTEETANLIAGQMNAIRINQANSLVIVREQLLVLNSINGYTAYIFKIYDYLVNQKAGSTLSGTGIKV